MCGALVAAGCGAEARHAQRSRARPSSPTLAGDRRYGDDVRCTRIHAPWLVEAQRDVRHLRRSARLRAAVTGSSVDLVRDTVRVKAEVASTSPTPAACCRSHGSGTEGASRAGRGGAILGRVPLSTGQRLLRHDRRLGARFVAGADKAGRGSLAGPLVVAGVLLDSSALRGHRVRPSPS